MTSVQPVTCDRTRPTAPDNEHDYVYVGDEYGSLADGGSYEIYDCRRCGRRAYSPMAD